MWVWLYIYPTHFAFIRWDDTNSYGFMWPPIQQNDKKIITFKTTILFSRCGRMEYDAANHKRHLTNVNRIVQMRVETAEWISLHCRRFWSYFIIPQILSFKYLWTVYCKDHKDVYIGHLCNSQHICYNIYSNGQKNCCAVSRISRGRLIKYPLSFIHIIYNMACVGRFRSRWCSVCVRGRRRNVYASVCLNVHTQVMNVLRIANVYNNPSAIPHHYSCRGNANLAHEHHDHAYSV